MIRIALIALVALLQTPSIAAAYSCAGAGPSIVSARVGDVTPNGKMNLYHINGTVTNVGNTGQPNNTLQFVDIYQGNEKLDAKAIPPLAVGQSYSFSYVAQRSADAGNGTTNLNFVLDMRQPQAMGAQKCSNLNDRLSVVF